MTTEGDKQPKKGVREFFRAADDWCYDATRKHIRPSDFSWWVWIIVVAVMLLIGLVLLYWPSIQIYFNSLIHVVGTTQTAAAPDYSRESVPAAREGAAEWEEAPSDPSAPRVLLRTDGWELAQGDFAHTILHPERFTLESDSMYGLLKYKEVIPKSVIWPLSFKAYGTDAINFVVSFPEVYEVVIGDSDRQTITMKVGDSSTPIPESAQGVLRPHLKYPIAQGKEISLNFNQRVMENGHLWLQFDVAYWTDGVNVKQQPETFRYEFQPPPKFQDSLFLHVGLTRGNATGSLSFEMVPPIDVED